MKLIGSKTEQDFRDTLIKSKKFLFEDKNQERLLLLLQAHFPEMQTAYFINHTPDQE